MHSASIRPMPLGRWKDSSRSQGQGTPGSWVHFHAPPHRHQHCNGRASCLCLPSSCVSMLTIDLGIAYYRPFCVALLNFSLLLEGFIPAPRDTSEAIQPRNSFGHRTFCDPYFCGPKKESKFVLPFWGCVFPKHRGETATLTKHGISEKFFI